MAANDDRRMTFGRVRRDLPSKLKDPIALRCVESVYIKINMKDTPQEAAYESTICFRNGLTTASHRIQADDWESLMSEIQATIEDIES